MSASQTEVVSDEDKMIVEFEDKDLFSTKCARVSKDEYMKLYHSQGMPIVIDNGAYEVRGGFACDEDPRLRFRSLVARAKSYKKGDDSYVGDQIAASELLRLKMRSPIDTTVLIHPESQEYLLDYTFQSLGMADCSSIQHPIMMTEKLVNPNGSRAFMSELLFEQYGVPSTCYAIDALCSWEYNKQQKGAAYSNTALVVDTGYDSINLMPIVEGCPQLQNSLRLCVGTRHLHESLLNALCLSYPTLKNQLSSFRAQELFDKYCEMPPVSLEESFQNMRTVLPPLREDNRLNVMADPRVKPVYVQLPFVVQEIDHEALEIEAAARRIRQMENIKRMREMAQKKSETKTAEQRIRLAGYDELKKKRMTGVLSKDEYLDHLYRGGFDGEHDFEKVYGKLAATISNTDHKAKILRGEVPDAPQPTISDEQKYPLIHIMDHELDPEQLKEKKKQLFLRNASMGRARARLAKASIQARRQLDEQAEENFRIEHPQEYEKQLREKKKILTEKIAERQRQLALNSGRRGLGSKRRFKALATLSNADDDDEGMFGDDASDWHAYSQVRMGDDAGGDSSEDSAEEELEGLAKIEACLQAHYGDADPNESTALTKEHFQLRLFVHRVKTPEIVFQPLIMGLDQAGLGECLQRMFARYADQADVQKQLCSQVFLTGGMASLPHLATRLKYELTAMRPQTDTSTILMANDAVLDAWKGARVLASQQEVFIGRSVTKAEYQECGPGYLREHHCSNRYFPTPQQRYNKPADDIK